MLQNLTPYENPNPNTSFDQEVKRAKFFWSIIGLVAVLIITSMAGYLAYISLNKKDSKKAKLINQNAQQRDPNYPKLLLAKPEDKVQDSYIVKISGQDNLQKAEALAQKYQGIVVNKYSTLNSFSILIPQENAKKMSQDSSIDYIEENARVTINEVSSWGLDRIDQRKRPLDGAYAPGGNGAGVNVYIIDTGVLASHNEFEGRVVGGYSAIDGDTTNWKDCHGHGTHVAGTVGGANYGVASGVKLYGVRVLDCNGSGTYEQVIGGIDWVTANHVKPAVANMSIGGWKSETQNAAVEKMIASGVTAAIAAGNSDVDACNFSPASAPSAITVGAIDNNDTKAGFSNYGDCVDVWAPGTFITSSLIGNNASVGSLSGTSMASPHVAGAAALYIQSHPGASPSQIRDAIVNKGTYLKIEVCGGTEGLKNVQMLYVKFNDTDDTPINAPTAPPRDISKPPVFKQTPSGSLPQFKGPVVMEWSTPGGYNPCDIIELLGPGETSKIVQVFRRSGSTHSWTWAGDHTKGWPGVYLGDGIYKFRYLIYDPQKTYSPKINEYNEHQVWSEMQFSVYRADQPIIKIFTSPEGGLLYPGQQATFAWDDLTSKSKSGDKIVLVPFFGFDKYKPGIDVIKSWPAGPDDIREHPFTVPLPQNGQYQVFALLHVNSEGKLNGNPYIGDGVASFWSSIYAPKPPDMPDDPNPTGTNPTPTPTSAPTPSDSTPTAPPSGSLQLNASPSMVSAGGIIRLSWSAPKNTTEKDWIGIFKKGSSNQKSGWWEYTDGKESGVFSVNAPVEAGQYEFRYLTDDSYTSLGASNTITVTASGSPTPTNRPTSTPVPTWSGPQPTQSPEPAASITVSPSSIKSNQDPVNISWRVSNGHFRDWIALRKVGDASKIGNEYWFYVENGASGKFSFPKINMPPGQYEFIYYGRAGTKIIDKSNPFTITE